MHPLRTLLLAALLALPATAQDVTATPGGLPTAPRAEPALAALTRANADTLALTLAPGKTLLLHDFDFNGEPVASDKIHLHQLAPGVYELSSVAYTSGFWRFKVADAGATYGLGERFDTLDHAHTILHNLPVALPPAEPHGATTPRPVPFFLSATGYGLALDPDVEATFDLNATDPAQIIIDLTAARLRVLLFTSAETSGRFPDLLARYRGATGPALAAPATQFAPTFSSANGLPTALTAALSAGLSGLQPSSPVLSASEPADPLLLDRWAEFTAFTPSPAPAPAGPLSATAQRFAALHASLQPYFDAAGKMDIPILRPLVVDFEDDPKTRSLQTEYLLGPALLVAPILDENTSRPVYLPAGDWLNFTTGEPFTGPRTVLAQAPADTIPVYARRGAIQPELAELPELAAKAQVAQDVPGIAAPRRIYNLLGPAAGTAMTMADPEGRVFTHTAGTLSISGGAPGTLTLRWRFQLIHTVTLNGRPLTLLPDSTATFEYKDAATIAWQ